MERHYSFFAPKGIDWAKLTERYRRSAESAPDVAAFVAAISPMLAELDDLHVWIESPSGGRHKTCPIRGPKAYRRPALPPLEAVRRVGDLGLVGRTAQGLGYVAIYRLTAPKLVERKLCSRIEDLFDTPGMIIDLRRNSGGSEPLAARIASRFTDQPRVYALSKYRSGPKADEFGETKPRILRPFRGRKYGRPMVALIGPGCVSSGEGFAQMLKALPQVTLMGRPTRGASGNPAPVRLPNGVRVWYSRWLDLLPDGTPLEGRGVPPDVLVERISDDTCSRCGRLSRCQRCRTSSRRVSKSSRVWRLSTCPSQNTVLLRQACVWLHTSHTHHPSHGFCRRKKRSASRGLTLTETFVPSSTGR
jgi:hypothetical protein